MAGLMEIAQAAASFFPDMAESAITSAVATYQKLGTWSGGIAIEKDLYESALDVFEHSNMVGSRHAYDEVVIPPPGIKEGRSVACGNGSG